MREIEIEPQDILDAIKSLEVRHRIYSEWITGWLAEKKMLTWAQEALDNKSEHAWADALTWAKRAICARIDRLITMCLLSGIVSRRTYPERIALLKRVGIEVPGVIYEFVIKPRNDLEHIYTMPPDQKTAKHAVEITQLGLTATNGYLDIASSECKSGCVAVNWNVRFSSFYAQDRMAMVDFYGYASDPMIFADVFGEGESIKIKVVDFENKEVRFAPLSKFNQDEAIELSILFNHWINPIARETTAYAPEFFKTAKREMKF